MALETRHVIVLGLSQHGKTTFLNGLLQSQGGQADAAVGNGTERCTVEPEVFKLHPPGQATQILNFADLPEPVEATSDEVDQEALNASRRAYWKQLSNDDAYEANVGHGEPLVAGRRILQGTNLAIKVQKALRNSMREQIRAQKERMGHVRTLDRTFTPSPPEVDVSPQIQVCALDTPGVEDNKGEDDEHIQKIIEAVIRLESLSGLVMVTKCGCPITPAWKSQILRYWRQFPMMQAQWIFVHTAADPYARNNPQRRRTSSFEEACANRVNVVTEAMQDLTGDEAFNAAHVFVESDVEDEEVLEAFLAKKHNTLFTLIANFIPIRIDSLPFQKGPWLLEIDGALVASLDAIIESSTETLNEVKSRLGELLALRNQHALESQSNRQSLLEIEMELQQIDHDGDVQDVKYFQKPWYFFSHPEADVRITSRHADYKISVVDTSGYSKSYLEVRGESRIKLDDGRHVIEMKLCTPYFFTSMSGKVVVASKSRDVYEERVSFLKGEQERFASILEKQRQTQLLEEENLGIARDEENKTLRRHKIANEMRDFVRASWTCEIYRAMRPFYEEAKACRRTSTDELLRKFQRVWVENVEECAGLGYEAVDVI